MRRDLDRVAARLLGVSLLVLVAFLALPASGSAVDGLDLEWPLAAPLYEAPGWSDQGEASAAFDGTNLLVVWTDSREVVAKDIMATRMTPAGTVLDAPGIPVSDQDGSESQATVVWNGASYFVVWRLEGASLHWDIYGARVSPTGQVLDDPIPLGTTGLEEREPSVAWNGTNHLVVWSDGADIVGRRVALDGEVVDDDPIVVSSAANNQWRPSVAWNGVNFLVVWEDYRQGSDATIFGARVAADGSVLDPQGFAVTAAVRQYEPRIAWNGTNHLVVWTNYSGSFQDIAGARVSTSGQVLDSTPIAISSAALGQSNPHVAWDGQRYLVTWDDNRTFDKLDVYGARVASDGTLVDGTGVEIAPARSGNGVAAAGDFFILAHGKTPSEFAPFDFDVFATRISGGLTIFFGSRLVSRSATVQRNPALAFDGTNYLAVWDEIGRDGKGDSDIVAAALSKSTGALDGTGLEVAETSGEQTEPAVAWNGDVFLAVWQTRQSGDDSDVEGALIGPDGSVGDPFSISVAGDDQTSPVVASDGSGFLVAWADWRSGVHSQVFGTLVSAAGVVSSPTGTPLSSGSQSEWEPALAWAGDHYLLVWEDTRRSSFTIQRDVFGARISAAGGVLDPDGFAISAHDFDETTPSASSLAGTSLIAWSDRRLGNQQADIFAARVSGAGTVLDSAAFPVLPGPGEEARPVVSSYASRYLVLWTEDNYLWGARVTPYGTLMDNDPIDFGPSFAPTAASGGSGDLAVGYMRRGPELEYGGGFRAFARLLHDADPVPPRPPPPPPPASPPPPAPPPPAAPPPSPPPPPPARPPVVARCVVPNVKGKTVGRARTLFASKRCKLGRVTRAYSQKVGFGKVISQSRRPGMRLARGAKVNVVVSRGRRR
jgi:hypothetical protein